MDILQHTFFGRGLSDVNHQSSSSVCVKLIVLLPSVIGSKNVQARSKATTILLVPWALVVPTFTFQPPPASRSETVKASTTEAPNSIRTPEDINP